MNYHHLTIEERCCIRKFYNDGLSFPKIARYMVTGADCQHTAARPCARLEDDLLLAL